ncbi:MAG: hypothetical protein ABJJ07_03185 [Maribacter dokdonensis]|uniref:hypothetical protein n=1 Tax=Maribacter dokdonensis TaxID=320912 RepID=UPI003298F764
MNNFEDLQNTWQNQSKISATEESFKSLLKSVKSIENKQRTGNAVLTITIITLFAFLLYVSGYKNATFLLGIALMICSLMVRIGIELFSLRRLRSINFSADYNTFKQDLTTYYFFRRFTHFIITPLAIIIYTVGFIILLPLFKVSLSHGFYVYILCSSIVFLTVLCVFIYRQVKNELNKLRQLQKAD